MTVEQFAKEFGYEVLCMPRPERSINGGYAGDLLSWVMGKLEEDAAWVTIMSNVNIVVVASLADPSCILLSEGVELENDVVEKANSVGVNILASKEDTFSLCASISKYL